MNYNSIHLTFETLHSENVTMSSAFGNGGSSCAQIIQG